MTENYLRLQQVLNIVNVSKTLFYKLRQLHSLRFYRFEGTKVVFYKESEVRAFMEALTIDKSSR